MLKSRLIVLALGLAILAASPVYAQSSDGKRKKGITEGPAKVQLKDVAQIDVPAGFSFVDGDTYRALLKKSGEPVYGMKWGCWRPPTTVGRSFSDTTKAATSKMT